METRRIYKEDWSVRDVWLTPVAGKLWDGGGAHNALLRSAATALMVSMFILYLTSCSEQIQSGTDERYMKEAGTGLGEVLPAEAEVVTDPVHYFDTPINRPNDAATHLIA